MPKSLLLFGLLVVVVVIVVVGCKATRSGYESPEYTIVKKDGHFEVRESAGHPSGAWRVRRPPRAPAHLPT